VIVIDNERGELSSSLFFPEAMLVNSDGFGPRVLPGSKFLFKFFVKGFKDVTWAYLESFFNFLKISIVLASPYDATFKALGCPGFCLNAWDVFCEWFVAGFTSKAPFFLFEESHLTLEMEHHELRPLCGHKC
jgi:hypothetical protein